MTILVHLNHGVNKSYMLRFGQGVRRKDVQDLLLLGEEEAVRALLGYARLYSVVRREVRGSEKARAEMEADMVISQHGYTSERLA